MDATNRTAAEELLAAIREVLERPGEWGGDQLTTIGRLFAEAGQPLNTTDPDEDPDENHPDRINMDTIVDELRKMRITAYVEQTGGNTATIYAGEEFYDPTIDCRRYPVAAGPGDFNGPGWTKGRAWRGDFTIGRNDQGETPSYDPPPGATHADMARMIAHVLAGREPIVGGVVPPLPDPTT